MKEIIKYQCEVCKNVFDKKKDALTCESSPKFKIKDFPIGLMYEYHHHDFVGIFALANPEQYDGHTGQTNTWAIRTQKYPYGGVNQLCGNQFLHSIDEWKKNHFITPAKTKCSQFKDMVAALKKKGITPRYYTPKGKLIIVK